MYHQCLSICVPSVCVCICVPSVCAWCVYFIKLVCCVCVCACVYVCMYVCMYVCIHTCMSVPVAILSASCVYTATFFTQSAIQISMDYHSLTSVRMSRHTDFQENMMENQVKLERVIRHTYAEYGLSCYPITEGVRSLFKAKLLANGTTCESRVDKA